MDKQLINFKIDGKEFQAAPGQTILNVAEANGISIPTLCFSKKISRTTSCFVCLVKDAKTGRFLPSCSACPVEGGEYESSTDEVADMRRTALELLLSEHQGDCEAPCTVACPAHAQVEEYVRAGRKGKFLDALKIIKKRIPLPMSIGRVCPRFCEKDCRKNVTGKPVAINDFKRLAADMFYETYMEELPALSGKKVAVIGAGPGGLAAAYYLRLGGVASKVFDKQSAPGGMLRYGIPEYRLPKAILDKELAHFTAMGIEVECGKELGKDLNLADLARDYDAVVAAIGCWKPSSMYTEGEELAEQGIRWLEINNCGKGKNPGRTIVVGGGNTAMDCVRTAVRLGAPEVTCCYRRTEKEMPAEAIEIHEAKEEGVKFEFLCAPLKIRREGDELVMTCQRMELGEPDASGRRKPVPVPGSEYDIKADTIIAAIGQATAAPEGFSTTKRGDIQVDANTNLMIGNIFAVGDCVSGAATVVEAVAGGRKAALSILRMLGLTDEKPERTINVSRGHWQKNHLTREDLVFLRQDVSEAERVEMKLIDLNKRKSTFDEVAKTLGINDMTAEGKRCIECSCTAKTDCKLKKHSETYGASTTIIGGQKPDVGYDNRHPSIIQDRMKCIKCGICVKVCKEVVNQNLLSAKKRGFSTEVSAAFGKPLPVSCTECGQCIEECPVGALDWKIKN